MTKRNKQLISVLTPQSVSQSPQKILNGEIHDWYRITLGYSDHLVSGLIDDFNLEQDSVVLDPFCGTGTTLVECMKRGLDSVGIDANPSSIFAARVKTRWTLEKDYLLAVLEKVRENYNKEICKRSTITNDTTYNYIVDSGMLVRGWISIKPLKKAIAIKNSILSVKSDRNYKEALFLALISEVVHSSSNIKFGPELYCAEAKDNADVFDGFTRRAKEMAEDLVRVSIVKPGSAKVIYGDSRIRKPLLKPYRGQFNAIICSPPYPTEHDYTRNARLELAFLEKVVDRDSLRAIKKLMIRSHTKGIYKGDDDARIVSRNKTIQAIGKKVDKLAEDKDHGFARLYGTVVRQYFGGMRRHFRAIKPHLARNSTCAYVVGDQSSYLQVHIPTAEILANLAELEGFKVIEIRRWRGRRSSTTSRSIDENILILRKIR